MTDERKNEIWAMLPEATKAIYRRVYLLQESTRAESYGRGYRGALADVFGKHNLTAQAEEKPKEPKFKVGDLVKIPHLNIEDPLRITRIEDGLVMTFWEKVGIKVGTDIEHIVPYTEPKENPKERTCTQTYTNICSSQNPVDWNNYRLYLAKEIAVAMITRGEKPGLCSRAEKAVNMANEIVKRLKETEE